MLTPFGIARTFARRITNEQMDVLCEMLEDAVMDAGMEVETSQGSTSVETLRARRDHRFLDELLCCIEVEQRRKEKCNS